MDGEGEGDGKEKEKKEEEEEGVGGLGGMPVDVTNGLPGIWLPLAYNTNKHLRKLVLLQQIHTRSCPSVPSSLSRCASRSWEER